LADAAGISLSAISRYEGDRREPTAAVIMSLARVLNITGDAILGIDPQPDLVAQNSDEASVLRIFRDLNDLGQERFLEYGTGLKEVSKFTKKK